MRKFLSPIANDVLQRCAQTLGTSVDTLISDFDKNLSSTSAVDECYSKGLVEFFSSKTIEHICGAGGVGEQIEDGSFSRFTYDMMLAWETPSSCDLDPSSEEGEAKGKDDGRKPLQGNAGQMHDDIPLFYSDIMPLLVSDEQSAGEEPFVWLASLLPLAADVANARFTFETLTAPTASRLHFPAYDRFLKEINQCIKYLEKQAIPTGVDLAADEFILHVDGTATTQRVVRHIGATSWPGRLTLTNKALYFEASGVISYETALKIDLSKDEVDHQLTPASTGPWGAPLFDKAISYESSETPEPIVLEFPEMTSSTRRDHWLALIKEVVLLHRFISMFDIRSPVQVWEIHARTILGIIRLHATREMLRISPPAPTNFLIFSLYDELPKGDFVMTELANGLKQSNRTAVCTASSILKSLNIYNSIMSCVVMNEEAKEESTSPSTDMMASLGTTIDQVRKEAKEVNLAKATVEEMKEEGISDSLIVLVELMSSFKVMLPHVQGILTWDRPIVTFLVLVMTLLIIYKEWAGYFLASVLMMSVGFMYWARKRRIGAACKEVVVSASTDKTTVESIVEAQHTLKSLHEFVKDVNITMLKMWSILIGRAPKQADAVMSGMMAGAIMFLVVPLKYVLMMGVVYTFAANSKLAKYMNNEPGNRRMKEWWESIPIIPVRTTS